jgi:hypothetical protein
MPASSPHENPSARRVSDRHGSTGSEAARGVQHPGDQVPQWEVSAVLTLAHLGPAYRGNPVQHGVPARRPAASGPLPLSVD